MRSGHNRAVDWWSLGALMYDMLTGAVSIDILGIYHSVAHYRLQFGFCIYILEFMYICFRINVNNQFLN